MDHWKVFLRCTGPLMVIVSGGDRYWCTTTLGCTSKHWKLEDTFILLVEKPHQGKNLCSQLCEGTQNLGHCANSILHSRGKAVAVGAVRVSVKAVPRSVSRQSSRISSSSSSRVSSISSSSRRSRVSRISSSSSSSRSRVSSSSSSSGSRSRLRSERRPGGLPRASPTLGRPCH